MPTKNPNSETVHAQRNEALTHLRRLIAQHEEGLPMSVSEADAFIDQVSDECVRCGAAVSNPFDELCRACQEPSPQFDSIEECVQAALAGAK